MAMGFYEQLDKVGERREIERTLADQESAEPEEQGEGRTLTEFLDDAQELITGEFVNEFADSELRLEKDEKKYLAENIDILKRHIKDKFESDHSLGKIKRNNLKHTIRNFFSDILWQADRYYRYKRENKDIGKIRGLDSYKKTIRTLNDLTPYLEYYIIDMKENGRILDEEIKKKHGYLEKYDFYRFKDFSQKHKHQLAYGDYLRLFYLFRKFETDGITKEEYQKLRQEVESPWQFAVSKATPPKIFNFEELEENLVEDENGNLRIKEKR